MLLVIREFMSLTPSEGVTAAMFATTPPTAVHQPMTFGTLTSREVSEASGAFASAEPSTASIEARVMRVIGASEKIASVAAGNMSCDSEARKVSHSPASRLSIR